VNYASRAAMLTEIEGALRASDHARFLIRLPAALVLIDLEEEEAGGETALSLGLRWMVRNNTGPIHFAERWQWGPRGVPPMLHAAMHSEATLYGYGATFELAGHDRAGHLQMSIPVLRWGFLCAAIEAMGKAIRLVRSVIDTKLEDVSR